MVLAKKAKSQLKEDNRITFALAFCNRGFMPEELICGAREDMVKAVTDTGRIAEITATDERQADTYQHKNQRKN